MSDQHLDDYIASNSFKPLDHVVLELTHRGCDSDQISRALRRYIDRF